EAHALALLEVEGHAVEERLAPEGDRDVAQADQGHGVTSGASACPRPRSTPCAACGASGRGQDPSCGAGAPRVRARGGPGRPAPCRSDRGAPPDRGPLAPRRGEPGPNRATAP